MLNNRFWIVLHKILGIIFYVEIKKVLKKQRQDLGISQSNLAQLSGLSLASVQNVEAGKANLSISNLASLLEVLGYDLKLVRRQVEWEKLICYGLPILPAKSFEGDIGVPEIECLEKLLVGACAEFIQREEPGSHRNLREREALQAMIMALRDHFPSVFQKRFAHYKVIQALNPRMEEVSGKIIKLRRIAIDRLSRYL